jgi:hypothetical protein
MEDIETPEVGLLSPFVNNKILTNPPDTNPPIIVPQIKPTL